VNVADVLIAAVVLSAAVGLLYRSFRKGPCHGCGGCPSGRKGSQQLVTLGGARERSR
jgi:hypothetical protein